MRGPVSARNPPLGNRRHRATQEEFIFLMSTWLRTKVPFLNLPTCPSRLPDEVLAAGSFFLDFLHFGRETAPGLSPGGAVAPPCRPPGLLLGARTRPARRPQGLGLCAEGAAAGTFQGVPSSPLGSHLRCHPLSMTGQRPAPLHGTCRHPACDPRCAVSPTPRHLRAWHTAGPQQTHTYGHTVTAGRHV